MGDKLSKQHMLLLYFQSLIYKNLDICVALVSILWLFKWQFNILGFITSNVFSDLCRLKVEKG